MSAPRRPFLTGATGFFGCHLVAALLRAGCEEVFCHVRAADEVTGRNRLVAALRGYGLWTDDRRTDGWADRLVVLPGDLEQPALGLGPAALRRLRAADAVIHNGAAVNYVLAFRLLKAANVTATQDALRLAEGAGIPFHFVSSLRLFDHRLDAVPIREDDPVDLAAATAVGYTHSKALAERLVAAAALRGLPTGIFRPGLMCGDGVVGAPNPRDAASLLVRGCVLLGAAPVSPLQVNLTSVDYAARGLVAIVNAGAAAAKEAGGGAGAPVWHLVHDTPTPMTRVFEALRAFGHAIEMVPYGDWVARLRDAAARGGNDLAPLFGYFTADFPEQSTRRTFDSARTRRVLAGLGVVHPDMTDAFHSANIRGMAACGYLPPVPAPSPQIAAQGV